MRTLFARVPSVSWSKDYLEHLRSVHFALAVTALALIVFSTSVKESDLDVACRQIREIQEMRATLPEQWENAIASERVKGSPQSGKEPIVSFNDQGRLRYARLTQKPLIWVPEAPIHDPGNPKPDLPTGAHTDSNSAPFGELSKGTLSEFKILWDRLGEYNSVLFSDNSQIATTMMLLDESKPAKNAYLSRPLTLVSPNEAQGKHIETWSLQNLTASEMVPYMHSDAHYVMQTSNPMAVYTHGWSYDPSDLVPAGFPRIVPLDAQGWFIRSHPNWQHGTFATAFLELDHETKGLQADSLEELSSWLNDQRITESASTFDAFGIKFPADSARRWGGILVLLLQIYFLLHLSQLSDKPSVKDSGMEVAWIGLYTSPVARILMELSSLLLPLCALVLAQARPVWEQVLSHKLQLSDVRLWFLIVSSAASVILGVLTQKGLREIRDIRVTMLSQTPSDATIPDVLVKA